MYSALFAFIDRLLSDPKRAFPNSIDGTGEGLLASVIILLVLREVVMISANEHIQSVLVVV